MLYFRYLLSNIHGERNQKVMNDEIKRQLVYGMLSLVLSAFATWLASYLTNKILGEAPQIPESKI